MSNKRPLTREELRMASRIKAAIAAIPGMTEDRVGAELGVSQGAVSHWTGGRLPVPVRRAAPLAALLNIDDPGEISLAYRQAVREAPPAVPSRSQPLRLDPEIIRDIAETLDERYELEGGFNLAAKAHEFARAYELWTGMSDASESKTLKLVIRHADLSPQGASHGKAGKEAPHTDTSGARVRTGSRGRKA